MPYTRIIRQKHSPIRYQPKAFQSVLQRYHKYQETDALFSENYKYALTNLLPENGFQSFEVASGAPPPKQEDMFKPIGKGNFLKGSTLYQFNPEVMKKWENKCDVHGQAITSGKANYGQYYADLYLKNATSDPQITFTRKKRLKEPHRALRGIDEGKLPEPQDAFGIVPPLSFAEIVSHEDLRKKYDAGCNAFHVAPVVAKDGGDRITHESDAGKRVLEKPYFDIYGPKNVYHGEFSQSNSNSPSKTVPGDFYTRHASSFQIPEDKIPEGCVNEPIVNILTPFKPKQDEEKNAKREIKMEGEEENENCSCNIGSCNLI